jgi:ketosteroid isomerase-like protein
MNFHPSLFASILFFITSIACNSQEQTVTNQDLLLVNDVLSAQLDAWNNGDINGFMEGYHQSDSIRFITGVRTIYGWDQVLQNYHKSFPNRDDMGFLMFSYDTIYTDRLPFILIEGNWRIHRHDTASGRFVLTFQKFAEDWKIVEDHTW